MTTTDPRPQHAAIAPHPKQADNERLRRLGDKIAAALLAERARSRLEFARWLVARGRLGEGELG